MISHLEDTTLVFSDFFALCLFHREGSKDLIFGYKNDLCGMPLDYITMSAFSEENNVVQYITNKFESFRWNNTENFV